MPLIGLAPRDSGWQDASLTADSQAILDIHRAKPPLLRLVGGALNGAVGKACKTISSTAATLENPCLAFSQSNLSASCKSSKKSDGVVDLHFRALWPKSEAVSQGDLLA